MPEEMAPEEMAPEEMAPEEMCAESPDFRVNSAVGVGAPTPYPGDMSSLGSRIPIAASHGRLRTVTLRTVVAIAAVTATMTSITTLYAAVPTGAPHGSNACAEDGDCAGTQLCRHKRCRQVECETDAGCRGERLCRTYRCVRRDCLIDSHCSVDRRCDDGVCVVPPPPPLRGDRDPISGRDQLYADQIDTGQLHTGQLHTGQPTREPTSAPTGIAVAAGLAYPIGVLIDVALPIGADRTLAFAVGTSVDHGGLGWRVAIRGAPHRLGPLTWSAWVAALGLTASARDTASGVGAILRGSGRGLFAWDQGVSAVWASAGGAAELHHGRGNRQFLRVGLGALLLLADVYPTDRDYGLLPSVSVSYGYLW